MDAEKVMAEYMSGGVDFKGGKITIHGDVSRAWMFSPTTGQFLDLNSTTGLGECRHSGFTMELSTVFDKQIVTDETIMRDFYETYDLEPLVKTKEWLEEQELLSTKNRVRATVEERCPNCGFHQMEFYTMQLRSADEGQTVFYECKECGHKFSTNT